MLISPQNECAYQKYMIIIALFVMKDKKKPCSQAAEVLHLPAVSLKCVPQMHNTVRRNSNDIKPHQTLLMLWVFVKITKSSLDDLTLL